MARYLQQISAGRFRRLTVGSDPFEAVDGYVALSRAHAFLDRVTGPLFILLPDAFGFGFALPFSDPLLCVIVSIVLSTVGTSRFFMSMAAFFAVLLLFRPFAELFLYVAR